ncbi:MAG: porin family protein [Bacteroidota bacterium]
MLPLLKKLFPLLLLLATLQVNAQNYLGLRGGLNYANVQTDVSGITGPNPETLLGLNIALFTELGVSPNFAIQPELHYVQKGWSVKFSTFGFNLDGSFVFNYLDVPVLFKYRFGNPRAISGYAIAGPSVGYLLSVKEKDNISNQSQSLEFTEDDGIRRVELSMVIGAGVNFAAGPGSILVDLRYNLGLSNLSNDVNFSETSLQNRALNMTIGYRFPLGNPQAE